VKFWIPWAIDAIVAAVAVFFFLLGIVDGSVSSFNIVLWAGLLLGLAALLGGSLWLRGKGHPGIALALLWVLAVPALGAGALILLLVVAPPRWN